VTPDPPTAERKLAARRFNERVKLSASFLSTLAVGTLGAAVIVPLFSPAIQPSVAAVGAGILVGVSLHLLAQWVFRFLRNED